MSDDITVTYAKPKSAAETFESGAAAFTREHAAIYAGVSTHTIDQARRDDKLLATSPHTEPRYTKANLDKWIERWPVLPARK